MSALTCPLCAHRFQNGILSACEACPLHGDCSVICCPACGHSMVDHRKSGMARLFLRLFSREKVDSSDSPPLRTLRQVPAGTCALVADLDALSLAQRENLQAYGLTPGRPVRVLQHAPVTVINVDQTEIALETDLAERILME